VTASCRFGGENNLFEPDAVKCVSKRHASEEYVANERGYVAKLDVEGSATAPHSALAQRNIALRESAQLREAILARDDFIAVAGHELRNSMTPIIGRVQLLRRMIRKPDFRPEQFAEGLDQIESLVGHFIGRATTLLNVSRMSTGKLRLDLSPHDVGSVVRQVFENYCPVAEYAGSLFTLHVPDEGLWRLCDPLALEQILDNLVSNAIKYGAGQPVLVSASEETAIGPLIIVVQDGGPGISPDDQARIFERFERAVRPGEHAGGFGAGLWIVRHLAEAMGGAVTVASQPNKGSTFTVSLPLRTSEKSK
jgi:two-component system, OmpR family, sensor kinase